MIKEAWEHLAALCCRLAGVYCTCLNYTLAEPSTGYTCKNTVQADSSGKSCYQVINSE